MELCFSTRHHQNSLSLISCVQLSVFSSAKPIRRDFLGCFRRLCPPSGDSPPRLRSRGGQHRRLGILRSQSRRFFVNSSLDVNSVVVVVVALSAVAAMSFVYLNETYVKKKKKKARGSMEVLDYPSFELSQLGRYIGKHIIGSWFLDVGELHGLTHVAQGNVSEKENENDTLFEEKELHAQFQKTTSMRDDSGIIRITESPGDGFLASKACTYVVSKEPAVAIPSPATSVLHESGVALPLMFATEMSELTVEKTVNETEFDSKFPEVMVKTNSSIVSVPVNHELGETVDLPSFYGMSSAPETSELTVEKTRKETEIDLEFPEVTVKTKSGFPSVPVNHESGERGNRSSFHGIIKESVREDLYTFYEANQSAVKSPSNFHGLKAARSHVFPLKGDNFPSLKVNTVLKEAGLSPKLSLQTADSCERKVTPVHNEGGSFGKNKISGRSRRFPKDKGRTNLVQNSHSKQTKLPYPNGLDANDEDNHLPAKLNAYNHLLRDERLSDCVNLLEDLETKGLLDMDKVYHAKFFKICKSKKAVKEAFRFCKLVPNPTLSTFNMLMSVCASSQDSEGAFQVLQFAQGNGLKADCKLYTTLISTCAKSGKVDAMFEVFHEMVNAGVEPNVHTYGALIDGCARAGQVAKAFGAYGIMRSKNVKPDRVVFNALITACGQSGAVDRAFDVLAEMGAENQPIDPDHVTIGALMKACAKADQVDRAKEVYSMLHQYNIKGTPEVYTIAVNCCSQSGDWEFACSVYDDMTKKGVIPDEMFLSAMINVAGHAGMLDSAFEVLQKARIQGIRLGIVPYSSLMGACSNAKNWQKALELYKDIKSIKLKPTVATLNALITALCDGDQLEKAIEILSEMKSFGLCPNTITYSILLVASERKDDLEAGLILLSEAKKDSIAPNLIMCKCLIGMCLRRFEKACSLGEHVLSFGSGRPQIENKWTSLALMVYREMISAGEMPTMEVVSQVLGCLQLPHDASVKNRLVENLSVTADSSRFSNLCSLVDGFGEYDPRAFSLLEEAASLGIVPCVSFKESPIVVDAKKLQIHTAEVYILTIFKGLKHRLAAGAKLPNVTILLPIEKTQIRTPEGDKTINLAGRISQSVASLLRRLGLPYQGNESYGKIRINGISLRRWFQPKLTSPFSGKPQELNLSQTRIGKGIFDQQRSIRTGNLSLE